MTTGDKPSAEQLAAYYDGRQIEGGFTSLCKMTLPAEQLKGKCVLNVACRRGKGLYKISDIVGASGEAYGIDWNEDYIAEARAGMNDALKKSGLGINNMTARVAYPEDLAGAGLKDSSFDAVYINNVVTLLYDPEAALREFARILKPGGLLIMETVLADRPRDDAVVEEARRIGNSIQAARTLADNADMLAAAGFGEPVVMDEYAVDPARGVTAEEPFRTVPDADEVEYSAACIHARKLA